MTCNMKPCHITSRSLIIARLSESNKTTAQIYSAVMEISTGPTDRVFIQLDRRGRDCMVV
jgi:hypothetical protein